MSTDPPLPWSSEGGVFTLMTSLARNLLCESPIEHPADALVMLPLAHPKLMKRWRWTLSYMWGDPGLERSLVPAKRSTSEFLNASETSTTRPVPRRVNGFHPTTRSLCAMARARAHVQ
eukprot:9504138-Pyramimonas_sp.AAC.1